MKTTKELIEALRNMRATPENAKLYQIHLRLAADRLEELSTGEYSVSAEDAKKTYTIQEFARMYDIQREYTQGLYDENKWLRNEIARLKGKTV